MANNISLVIRREFLERVKKKSFIITTILMPVFMLAMMAAPALIMMVTGSEERGITVIDETGTIGARLQSDKETHFTLLESTPLDSALADTEVAGVLYIPAGIMDGKVSPRLYTNGSSSIALENNVSSQIDGIIEEERLKQYDIENLDKILEEVHSDVKLMSIRNDKEDGESQSASAAVSYLIGIILTFLLYMCLLLYGQMVMTSIIEEKNNRVLEIVVSSVKPTHLMLGKICGIGLVAVTQILIWGVLIAAMSAFVLPAIIPDTALTEMSALNAGTLDATSASMDVEILQAMSLMSNVGYILQIFGLLILFLTGGFLLYAAIYAAIGSAVDNIQDASQLQSFVIFPIIIGIIFGMTAASDASSPAAIWTSFIPFTSPMVMMARVPSGIPMWEIGLSLAILYASFLLMVWIAAKIYRVGIFMYGKKPSIKDLIRWARYK
ncbi:ABC transporter permease [Paramuribaculum intestinale]|uniref:ABC transporter permease n=1 Tax=Paramuribaculum intestinale TaxID=2094151 RepID=UPI002731616D|nr:ABC transporter permease [Paramuribaculum intestinale]